MFEGGVARFDLTFIRAETRRYPAGVENTEAQAEDAADAADAAAQADTVVLVVKPADAG